MMYKRNHKKYNSLTVVAVCSVVAAGVPSYVHADAAGRLFPLRVYIPNVSSLASSFNAGTMEYDARTSTLRASGKVEIESEGIIVVADSVEYNQLKNSVNARGNVAILGEDGVVKFADKAELTSKVKEKVIETFRTEMADSAELMVADNARPNVPAAKHTVKDAKVASNSIWERTLAYFSPPNNNSLADSASSLSRLEPAAGESTAENTTVIGSVPLINLPEIKPETGANQEIKQDGASSKVTAEEAKQEVVAKSEAKIEEAKPVADAVKPAQVTLSQPVVADDKAVKEKEAEVKASVPEEKKSASKPITQTKKTDNIEAKSREKLSASEEALSPESLKLLNKATPSAAAEKPTPAPKSLDINRAHGMQDLFKVNDSASAASQGELLGVKVENKEQQINIDGELERAYNAISAGQSDIAIDTYKNILSNAPNNTNALFGLATLYHRARQLDKARSLYARLLAIAPSHRDGFNNFLVLLADEAPREAIIELEKLEEKNPGFSTIPAQLAVIYQKSGDNDKAIGKMFRAVALAPENLTYRYNLAIMLDKQKNYDEAAKLYKQLIEAVQRGEKIPGNVENIQQRLTFISSNRP